MVGKNAIPTAAKVKKGHSAIKCIHTSRNTWCQEECTSISKHNVSVCFWKYDGYLRIEGPVSTPVYSVLPSCRHTGVMYWKQTVTLESITVVIGTLTLQITVIDYLYFNEKRPTGVKT